MAGFLQSCSRTFFDSSLQRSVAILTGSLLHLWSQSSIVAWKISISCSHQEVNIVFVLYRFFSMWMGYSCFYSCLAIFCGVLNKSACLYSRSFNCRIVRIILWCTYWIRSALPDANCIKIVADLLLVPVIFVVPFGVMAAYNFCP